MLSIRTLSKSFGGVTAVDECSFDIARGSITGLIGPNGAGKTTLFNIAAGFLKPDSGRILLDGQDITALSPHERFHLGLVRTFQLPQTFQRMTVRENLMVAPPEQSGENLFATWFLPWKVAAEEKRVREKADEVLDFLEIPHVADELAGNLSGGQKKLLELGRCLMTDAKMVLLDEPGAGVNPTLMVKLTAMIRRLNEERGFTVCIIEHDMDVITELCDPVVCMSQGAVIAHGSMADIRANEDVLEAYLGGGRAAAGRGGRAT
ncbi:MAG: ABC transporter ATP-binding protein [Alphaproteobacteria bacterium]|nr:ABC transporter ATP-binding protein [Alphaproteobacteria bacterium]